MQAAEREERKQRAFATIRANARGEILRLALASLTPDALIVHLNALFVRDLNELYNLYNLFNNTYRILPVRVSNTDANTDAKNSRDWLSQQPNDHLTVIVSLLSDETRARIRRCCKRFHEFIVPREYEAEYNKLCRIVRKLSAHLPVEFPHGALCAKYPRATILSRVPTIPQYGTVTSLTLTLRTNIPQCMDLPSLRTLKCDEHHLAQINAPGLTHLTVRLCSNWHNVVRFFECPLVYLKYGGRPQSEITCGTLRGCMIGFSPRFAEYCAGLTCQFHLIPVKQRHMEELLALPPRILRLIHEMYVEGNIEPTDFSIFENLHTLRVPRSECIVGLPRSIRSFRTDEHTNTPTYVTELSLDLPAAHDFTNYPLTKLCIYDATFCQFPLLPMCLKRFIYMGCLTIEQFRTLLRTEVEFVRLGIPIDPLMQRSRHTKKHESLNKKLIEAISLDELARSNVQMLTIMADAEYTWHRLG